MNFTPEQEVLRTIISKCWNDDLFKHELVNSSDPVSLINSIVDEKIELPEGIEMVVVDQTSQDEIHINIPAEPDVLSAELTEKEMEMVTGGSMNELRLQLTNKPKFSCRNVKPNVSSRRFV